VYNVSYIAIDRNFIGKKIKKRVRLKLHPNKIKLKTMENKTVLVIEIVEDEPSVKSVLADKLHKEGFSVIEATNGKEGLDLALQKHPDLILLDIKMPVMGGIEMLKLLRSDSWGKQVPVMVLSNLNDVNVIADAMDRSTFEYFVKADIKLQDVIEKIKQRLNVS